jgi:D-alanyl-D-alanine-carboxypeptidase/D-alanyl-D-alanine-endopeptidase
VREAGWQAIEQQGVEAGIAVYQELKASRPPEAFDEFVLNTLGYRLLGSDRVEGAIEIFKLNVEEYPDASNPYDSLGEAYMEAGELELAIENYERSLELDPDNTNAVRMLERIRDQMGVRD